MLIDGVNGASSRSVQKKTPVVKPKPQTAPIQTNEYANSKRGNLTQSGAMLKHKLQNPVVLNQQPIVAFKQPTIDPYENQTASQISDDRINDYENASDKQDSAEDTGRLIADIAKYDAVKAREVADLFLSNDKIENGHRDELAQEFVREFDDAELRQVAGSTDGRQLLSEMRGHLLGGSVHSDEFADASRITNALTLANGVFADGFEGAKPGEGYGQNPAFEETTPEEGAQWLIYNGPIDDASRTQSFTEALEVHKDDPEWIANFFSQLGPDRTADLVNRSTSPSTYNPSGIGTDPEYAHRSIDAVRTAFDTLEQNGLLNQEGMDALVDELAGGVNPYLATELFSNSNLNVRAMFVNAAARIDDDGLNASAMEVLNTLPTGTPTGNTPYTQNTILNNLSDSELNDFVTGAMRVSGSFRTFDDSVSDPQGIRGVEFNLQFGGVERLVGNATDKVFQYYPYSSSSGFSEELQTRIFGAVANGLNDDRAFDNMSRSIDFKENMSALFIQNRDQIIESYTSNNDLTEDGVVDISKFAEIALFTPPLGDSSNLNLNRLPDAFSNFLGELTTDARDNGNTTSARLAGRLLGAIDNAAERASKRIDDDKAARDKFIDTVVGFAFDLIPFPGVGKLGEGGSALLKRAFASLEGILKKETLDRLENMTAEQAKAFLAEELKGNDELRSELQQQIFSDLFTSTVDQLGAGISADAATNVRTVFESAYTNIDFGNEGNNPRFE